MRPLAERIVRPAGRHRMPSDLAFISEYVAIIAAVFAVIGILLLQRFAGRSIGFMVAIVVAGLHAHLDGRRSASSPSGWWAPRPFATRCST